MAKQVGTLIREMRTAGGWTLGRLAQKAGVSKATLSQWESGARQPRIVELEAVLETLDASLPQRAQVLAHIEAPRALRRLRHADITTGLGPPPTAGDLLHAMRLRRGYTQEQASAQVGVGQTAIARWERGERLPSGEQIQALCYALGAREEELVALTLGRFAESTEVEPGGREEQEARLLERLMWHHYDRLEEDGGCSELEYMILERKAWLLASQEKRARSLLARIYAFHADAMRNEERWSEVAALARRALALVPRQERAPDFAVRAAVLAAAAAVYGGSRPAPQHGLHLLQPWLARSPSPDYRAWILSELAEYLAMNHCVDAARTLAQQACQLAEGCIPTELFLRRVDQERVLLKAGCPEEALRVTPESVWTRAYLWPKSYPFARRALTLAEAYQQVGDLSHASEWLQQAYNVIEARGQERLRPKATLLAQRF